MLVLVVMMVRQMGSMVVLRVDRRMRLLLPHSQLVGIAARRAIRWIAGNVGGHGRGGCQR